MSRLVTAAALMIPLGTFAFLMIDRPPAQDVQATSSAVGRVAAADGDVARGRYLVVTHACADCHATGVTDPNRDTWLTGDPSVSPSNKIGPFQVYPRNLTPDDETGLGKVSERQIFNALRYGLKPKLSPDVEITSTIPGQGNHPAKPNYLSPAMPWIAWRHMPDQDIRDIAAYLKRGLKPVNRKIPDSEGPPDGWASEFAPGKIAPYPAAAFPASAEVASNDARVKRGRQLVLQRGCAECHGGIDDPSSPDWLQGSKGKGPLAEFPIGPFKTRPRNLTPDNLTGTGRFSERQIFNALRFGLRPGETPDVEITGNTPGQGNYPANPKYLAPPMPWPSYRHMTDQDTRDIAAYLKRGLKPVRHKVVDSEGPPDFWASGYTVEKIGPFPVTKFPGKAEKMP
jgi:mono/diheme cytochrome c family protein